VGHITGSSFHRTVKCRDSSAKRIVLQLIGMYEYRGHIAPAVKLTNLKIWQINVMKHKLRRNFDLKVVSREKPQTTKRKNCDMRVT